MVGKYSVPGKLMWSLAQLLTLFGFATCYTCNTPDDWLNLTLGEIWTNGVVKYKLHSSLTSGDTSEVLKAFEEFHTKTCIRFQPWRKGDPDFVSIEVNDDVCGAANVCKTGGYQFAQFGKDCRNMATMVHQLGHALCLSHEHQRPDRDKYLRSSWICDSDKIPRKIDSFRFNMTIYDYASQMHSNCGSCEGGWPRYETGGKCGHQLTPGLSILDVDKLNSLYNCQGCRRHRWVPAAMLSSGKYDILTFGYQSKNGPPIYACRAHFKQQVATGTYHDSRKICKIPWGGNANEVTDGVEVLTIAGGTVGADCSVYKLENWENAEYSSLVKVGSVLDSTDTIFVAFSPVNGGKGYVGKAWSPSGNTSAEFPVETKGVMEGNFQVLTCSFDTTC